MKWVGLTGGIACGKTTVANIFRELGVPVLDADQLAHSVLEKNPQKIANYFGADVLDENGKVDRRALGKKVFENDKQLKALEAMIHPFVQKKVAEKKALFESTGVPFAVYDVPLLYEKNLQDSFDEVIVVYVPEEVSIQRMIDRNQLTEEEAKLRVSKLLCVEKKKELADVVIDNQADRDELKLRVKEYFNQQPKS